MLLELYVNLEAAGKTEHAHEAKLVQFSISCYMHASGRTLEVIVFVQPLWLKTKSASVGVFSRNYVTYANAILYYTLVYL